MRTTLQVVGQHPVRRRPRRVRPSAWSPRWSAALDVVVARAQLPVQPPAWLPTPREPPAAARACGSSTPRSSGCVAWRGGGTRGGDDVLGLLLRAQDEGLVTRPAGPQRGRHLDRGRPRDGRRHHDLDLATCWPATPEVTRRVRDGGRAASARAPSTLAAAGRPAVHPRGRRRVPAAVPAGVADQPSGPRPRTCCAGTRSPRVRVVIMSPTLVHRDPALWPDPDAFDPERFVGARRDDVDRRGYLPFGAGPAAVHRPRLRAARGGAAHRPARPPVRGAAGRRRAACGSTVVSPAGRWAGCRRRVRRVTGGDSGRVGACARSPGCVWS